MTLASLGCDHLQGHFCSRPLRAQNFAQFFLLAAAGSRPETTEKVGARSSRRGGRRSSRRSIICHARVCEDETGLQMSAIPRRRRLNADETKWGARAMFVTPLYAGLLTLWFLVLSARVVNLRRRGIPFGDNGEVGVIRIVRAQANFAEYVPLALLLMGVLEVSRHSIYVLHALGLTLLVARSDSRQRTFVWLAKCCGRVVGSALTFGVLLIEAVLCIFQGFRGQWIWFQ